MNTKSLFKTLAFGLLINLSAPTAELLEPYKEARDFLRDQTTQLETFIGKAQIAAVHSKPEDSKLPLDEYNSIRKAGLTFAERVTGTDIFVIQAWKLITRSDEYSISDEEITNLTAEMKGHAYVVMCFTSCVNALRLILSNEDKRAAEEHMGELTRLHDTFSAGSADAMQALALSILNCGREFLTDYLKAIE